ncbi:MAG: LacI family DNA-binding transcriptional regulator [Acidobacteriaceae bacterium]|nr:LacI family DNA-binding transcriptional regulator [Acidobacteriaceae bacterium]
MPVSIKDIARLAGVSHSTVSRALRKSPLIPATTAERIQRIADQAGYAASAVARSLVTRRTHTIGVVVTSIADPFNGEVFFGIEELANRHGYSVVLANSHGNAEREIAVVQALREHRFDGVLVASSRVGALYIEKLSELQIPIVLINNHHTSEFAHSVTIDNVDGAWRAVRHLIQLGHREIAYIGDRFGLGSNADREAGYRKALRSSRIKHTLIVPGDGKPEGGVAALRKLLALRSRPTAVFCYNDMTALGVLREAAAQGVQSPRQLSVVGFDDLFFAPLLNPPLTTVHQPRQEIGRTAMKLLLALLEGRPAEKTIRIKGELIVRGSTAPPAALTNRSE